MDLGVGFRWREGLARAALLLLSVAFSLALAEVIVRLTGAAPEVVLVSRGRFRLSPNPKIGYAPTAAVHDGSASLDFYDWKGEGNSLGYRDDEHEIAKPPGTYRIVVLGDSIGEGILVQEGREIFPLQLQRRLREDGIHAEVINLSVSGYNTQQEVETLKDVGLAYSPDLVVLAYCLNDRRYAGGGIMEALLDLEEQAQGIPRARVVHPLWIRSALYRLLRFGALHRGEEAPEHRARHIEPISEDTSEAHIMELGRLAEEHGFEAIVAVFPILDRWDDYPYPYEHERLERLARKAGLLHLDLLEPLAECAAETDVPMGRDMLHPGPEGHQCAADALADFIELRIFGRLP